MKQEKNTYYLGLDMGTESIGWAVTDSHYVIQRRRGKDLWGVREFDPAQGAVDRRLSRIGRRRRQREQVRISLLKSYFHDAVTAEDELFFVRLDNSKYFLEDKDSRLTNKNVLFDEADYTDADYYREYPTIFHLRKALIEMKKPEHAKKDLQNARFVYLALLNMFKHRGHFLQDGELGEASRKFADIFSEAKAALEELLPEENNTLSLPLECMREIEKILLDKELSPSGKCGAIEQCCGIKKNAQKKEHQFLAALCGLSYNLKILFDLEEDAKLKNSDAGFEDKLSGYLEVLSEEQLDVVALLKEAYDVILLKRILGDHDYLSQAMVESFEKHKRDLAVLKKSIKRYCSPETYDTMFRIGTGKAAGKSYSAYVKSVIAGKKQRRGFESAAAEEFFKEIKTLLKGHEEDEAVAYILDEIEKESFLPKQRSSANGTIPNQVHAKEMKKILANAEVFLPFLSDVDASGLTVAERILRLFSFHLPYYVGPVSENSKTGWVVRKEAGSVLPWNIEDKIDMAETSKKFIENLIRTCTYLEDEKVLPKNSLLYERYRALNEINNLRIDGERLTVEQKQEFYRDKIQKGKRMTKKAVAQYFRVSPEQISGIDERINNVASSYKKFYDIFGEEMRTDQTQAMVEEIIEYATIYGDDKKMLRKKLSERYPHLEDAVLKRVCGMKFKDWGRLSRELLLLRGCNKATGEVYSLIQAMWEENLNFMQLISSKDFTFREELEKRCVNSQRSLAEMTYEDLDGKYLSAPVKRMVWQTLLLLKEIEKIMGCPPAKVFVEVTRSDEKKKERKQSRKDQLLALYKTIKDETNDWVKELEALDEGQLRSKKLYLYYTQMGRDMYTGKPIDLDQLFNDNLYDIDHIYPRHFVKDDSIHNNLVLVDKRENTKKSDAYPLEDRIQQRCKPLWKNLRDKQLINAEKYKRLTQKENIFENDEIRADFIARQLVETSQANKAVADLLKQALPESKIVYSKARNVSDFRRGENGSGRRITDSDGKNKLVGVVKFPKSRLVNDLHHAHDAYLNIVVGNVYYSKFEGDPKQFVIKKYNTDRKKYDYNLNRMFSFDLSGAWVRGEEGTIATVRKMLAKTSPLFTRMTFEQHGALSKLQPVSAKDAKNELSYLPLKTTDARLTDRTRYGGYQQVKNAYFFLVEHTKGKKRIRTIETLPIHRKEELEQSPEALLAYCREALGLRDPEIRLAKIKPQSLIRYNGFLVQISSKSGAQFNVRNANNLFLSADWVEYICDLEKEKTEACSPERNLALYDLLTDKHSTGIFAKRLNAVGGMLQKGRAKFIGLEPAEQRRVLLEILQLSAIGLTKANLTAIGGSPNSGVMKISNNVSNAQEFLLIHQSVTGVYEKVLDLKKI